ncbi:MAG TPA: hypothetical protein VMB52_06705 [Verrucomicrobiae bacterium]|nr:hypothetical protein [Verrucomicrobiae bacterium]
MKLAKIALHVTFGTLILIGLAGSAQAATKNNSSSSNSTSNSSNSTSSSSSSGSSNAVGIQIYTAASQLQTGTIVQLGSSGADSVAPSTYAKMQQMYGVVADPNALPLTITDGNIPNQTYVATDGTYKVLVDTQNGTINVGDYVTISALDGVAMKAGTYDQQPMVLGRAVAGFDGKTSVIGTTTLKDTNGANDKTVQIGLISVAIEIERNPDNLSTKSNLPPWLQKVGQQIAQKNVSPIRIYLSIAITGLCVIVALVTLYAGIRNAIIAIGRNPLSKKTIFRGLLEIVLTGFLILIIGLFAVYLLLKL